MKPSELVKELELCVVRDTPEMFKHLALENDNVIILALRRHEALVLALQERCCDGINENCLVCSEDGPRMCREARELLATIEREVG